MKKLIIILGIVLVGMFLLTSEKPVVRDLTISNLNLASFCNSPGSVKQTTKKEFEVKSGGKLIIDMNTGGSIEIIGWDKDLLTAEIENDNDEIEFSFDKNANEVTISSEYIDDEDSHHSNVKLIINLPKKFDVEFSTLGGEVSISYVDGRMEGRTMGGDLDLRDLKGNLDITTMGGSINLKDSEVDGKVHTMGGEVLVENVKGDVNASSMGGKVRHINVTGKDKSIGNEVNITTMGGDLDIDTAPNGAKLKTMGGDITANLVGKFLNAETMGGDIMVKAVDGWVKATTMGGDINVTVTGNPDSDDKDVTLSSMGGDITLVVPAGLSMDIDFEIAYTKGNDHLDFEDCKIVSDFKINEERTTEWEKKNGTPRKYVYGTGTVNGGKNKIKIKTINGCIYLKKG